MFALMGVRGESGPDHVMTALRRALGALGVEPVDAATIAADAVGG